jgi:hypothetical protein
MDTYDAIAGRVGSQVRRSPPGERERSALGRSARAGFHDHEPVLARVRDVDAARPRVHEFPPVAHVRRRRKREPCESQRLALS